MNYLDSDTAVFHAEHHTSNSEFKRNISHHHEWKRNRKYDDLSVVQWFCSLKTGCWILMTNVIVLGFDFGKWLDMSGIHPPKQKEAPKASTLDSFHYGRMIQCEELPTTNKKASHHQTLQALVFCSKRFNTLNRPSQTCTIGWTRTNSRVLKNKVQTTQIYTSGPGELQSAKTCIQCDTLTFVTLRLQILHLEWFQPQP